MWSAENMAAPLWGEKKGGKWLYCYNSVSDRPSRWHSFCISPSAFFFPSLLLLLYCGHLWVSAVKEDKHHRIHDTRGKVQRQSTWFRTTAANKQAKTHKEIIFSLSEFQMLHANLQKLERSCWQWCVHLMFLLSASGLGICMILIQLQNHSWTTCFLNELVYWR